ncbi:hypothetical protein BU24DRAFT_422224 [Aaosphaeria arxii CBS 175.79]|uniref:DUF7580 domain-containing protein n=1 Tax=Aaosphaeria arxii CBS 175.79 TaxID=1450172 RepID=A0A6A5XSJ8_9PLEO|nr:uncharacterized protein BU24DRAFT_422224 [Aaosphaeria arxii CBS 175.79]KAF2015913.1 hypothetical protein BU24DRAFT_422224 [Aaosphaeria arxii CBS 175.79]
METAGVVLGAVPLILFALENYGKVWDPLKQAWRWEETVLTMKNDIFLQKQQLDTTLEALGLVHPTMSEVELALQMFHPLQCEQFMHTISEMDDLINTISNNLYPDADGPPSWAYARSDRVQWEWRRVKRGFGSRKRKEIIKQLQSSNIALRKCGLEKREIPTDSHNRIVTSIRGRFDDKRTKAIRANAVTLHEAISLGLGCNCPDAHRGNLQLNWHENKPLATGAFHCLLATNIQTPANNVSWKSLSMFIEEGKNHSSVTSRAPTPITNPTLSPLVDPSITHPSLRQSDAKTVRIFGFNITREPSRRQKSPCQSTIIPSASSTTIINPLLSPRSPPSVRPLQLCSALQTTQITNTSLGYLPIPNSNPAKQLHVVLEDIPGSTAATTKRTIHLRSLLHRTLDIATNRRLGLSRKQRFGVAAALTWAVLHLRDSPWLTGTLDDEAIHMFFESQQTSTTPTTTTTSINILDHPYFSYDFHTSNPPTPRPSTPAASFQSTQIPNLFLFTLGIRLIELGRNIPFSRLRQDYQSSPSAAFSRTSTSSTQAPTLIDDFEVAKAQYDELCLDPGPSYANAVDRCLSALFPGGGGGASMMRHSFENPGFRRSFYEDVVAPVQATFQMVPGEYRDLVI